MGTSVIFKVESDWACLICKTTMSRIIKIDYACGISQLKAFFKLIFSGEVTVTAFLLQQTCNQTDLQLLSLLQKNEPIDTHPSPIDWL